MKIKISLAFAAAAFVMPGAVTQVQAQEQVVETIVCQSGLGERASCPVNGEIISVGVQRSIGNSTPCFINYTWGFEDDGSGIWAGNGCSAEFAVTVERATPKPQADPAVLRDRLKKTRRLARRLRNELAEERESRGVIEAELADALAALDEIDTKKAKRRKPQAAIRAVAICSNRAVRNAEKRGASHARVVEIVKGKPTEGAWQIVGRLLVDKNNNRSFNHFRCWTDQGKLVSFEDIVL